MRENNKIKQEDLIKAANDLQRLVASQQTLLLATSSTGGVPDISYAPFVQDTADHFFIFVSELATHTANLLNNPKASVMLIKAESESLNLFARERVIYSCLAKKIARNDERYAQQLDSMQKQFGQVMTLLRSLNDFHLFELVPENGRYIAGFGRAFTIDMRDGTVSPVSSKLR